MLGRFLGSMLGFVVARGVVEGAKLAAEAIVDLPDIPTPNRSKTSYRGVNFGESYKFDSRVSLEGQDFSGASLRFARFNGCNLKNAIFLGADIHGASFDGADLTGVDFRKTHIDGRVSIKGAIITGVKFSRGMRHKFES